MQVRYKALIIAALAIIGLFLVGGYFGFRTGTTEARSHVMAFDTTAIVLIEFVDFADHSNNLEFSRIDQGWERMADRSLPTDASVHAQELLRQFYYLPVKRDMGMIGLVGERHELTPDTWSRITFIEVDGISHSLYLGRSTFAPGQVGAWTYVNVPNEKVVYAVEGLLTSRLKPGAETL